MIKTTLKALILGLSLLATVAQAKQLTIGITQEFENMNPIIGQMSASKLIYYNIGHPLNSLNVDWKWECFLCVTTPSLENGKAKKVKINGKETIVSEWEIKANAKWGDGTPITGNDVKLAWEIGSSPNVSVGSKDIYDAIVAIDVDAKNPKKFKVTNKEARYDFYQMAGLYLVPSHLEGPVWQATKGQNGAYEKQTKFTTDPTNPGLFSGPYLVKEIKLGSHVTLVKNPHFYGAPAKIDTITYRLIPNTQTLEANLLSGTIDMICELGMTFDQAIEFEKRLKKDAALGSKFAVNFRDGMTYEHIDFNLRNPALSDLRVRQALLYGVNRQDLVNALFEGRQKVALHNIHPLDEYYTDKVQVYKYDPEKAKKLLDEAGWKVGQGGIRMKDGKKLSLSIMTTAQNKSRELVQVYLQQEWKKLGLEISIKNEPARVFFGETVRKAQYPDMAMYAWVSAPDSPPRSTMHSSEIPSQANGFKGQNSGGYSNKDVDQTFDKIQGEFSFKKRKELMSVIQKRYTDDLPVMPLYLRAEISVTPKSMKNFKMTGHQYYSTLWSNLWDL